MLLCILTIQVSSCLFSWCKTKEKQKEKIVLAANPNPNERNRKKMIRDEPGLISLTESQKTYVYAIYPVVKHFCVPSAKMIIRLIVTFLGPPRISVELNNFSPCSLSPDNQWIATGGSNSKSLTLWNLESGEKQWTFKHDDGIWQFLFTSDNQYLISASDDTTLKIWSVRTGNLLSTLRGHRGWVRYCALTVDNRFLLSTSFDHTVRLWSVETGTCINVFHGHTNWVFWSQFFANDQRIVSAAIDVRVWDIESGQCVQILHGHTDVVVMCAFSRDEQLLLSGSYDTTVKVWHMEDGTCLQTFSEHQSIVTRVCFVCKDTTVASVDYQDTLYIWRWINGEIIYRFEGYNWNIHLKHSYWLKNNDTECIIVATRENHPEHPNEIHVLAVESGKILYTFGGDDTEVNRVYVSADGRFLISCSKSCIRKFAFTAYKK